MHISEELTRIISYAREETMRTGTYGISVDHLLLGILRHEDNDAVRSLCDLGIDPADFKHYVESEIVRGGSVPYSDNERIIFSRTAQNVLNLSVLEASRFGDTETRAVHMLLAISRASDSICQPYMLSKAVTYEALYAHMRAKGMLRSRPKPSSEAADDAQAHESGAQQEPAAPQQQARYSIDDFGYDLTEAALSGQLDPVVGREQEIARVVEILGRRKKNNPMLIGEPGVGKSAIVEGIALRIAGGNIPASLAKKRIVSLDIASVVAGTRYRGDFEKRIKDIIEDLKSHQEIILFIDEFHTIVGAGGAQGSLDAANLLKPALARGEIQCIGATTMDEFTKIVEKDGALDRRFQKIVVEPADISQTISILRSIRGSYEEFHSVRFTDGALEACARLTDRYVTDRCLPDKAIDAMDEAGSMARLKFSRRRRSGGTVDADDIAAVVSRMTGIPVSRVAESEGTRLLKMKERLKSRIIGQDEAVDTVVRAIQRNRAGLKAPDRPIGSFLFFGSTGVGKTQLAKCLAEYLFDSEDNIIRIDMSEYGEKFSTSRLIGAPPGYVGYEEGGQLSERVRRKPYSVVLLDEIEKANPDIYNLLLQVLDDGRLTDSNGRTVSFRNTIVIMTSNVGTRELEEYGNGIGFSQSARNVSDNRHHVLEKAIRKTFPPEFINRVDERVFFNPLTREDLEKIIDIELADLRRRVREAGYQLSVTSAAKRFVAESGYDPVYGARPLKRAVTRLIEDPVSERIISDRMLGHKNAGEGKTLLKVTLGDDKQGIKVI